LHHHADSKGHIQQILLGIYPVENLYPCLQLNIFVGEDDVSWDLR